MLSRWIMAVVQVETPKRTKERGLKGEGDEMEVVHSIKSGHIISSPILDDNATTVLSLLLLLS